MPDEPTADQRPHDDPTERPSNAGDVPVGPETLDEPDEPSADPSSQETGEEPDDEPDGDTHDTVVGDEPQDHDADPESEGAAVRQATAPAATAPAATTRPSVQAGVTPERTWSGRRTANDENVTVIGELHVFYRERTIVVPVDGDAAMRLMAGWQRNRPGIWADPLDPSTSPAVFSWAAISFDGVLGMVWLPGLGHAAEPQRMAVDPALA